MEAYAQNAAYHSAKPYIVRVNQAVEDFIALALARYDRTPDGFDISSEGWLQTEREIGEAIADRDEARAVRLAQEYEERAVAYLNKWRKILDGHQVA